MSNRMRRVDKYLVPRFIEVLPPPPLFRKVIQIHMIHPFLTHFKEKSELVIIFHMKLQILQILVGKLKFVTLNIYSYSSSVLGY